MFKFGLKTYQVSNNKMINEIAEYLLLFLSIALSRDTLYTTVKFGFYTTFFVYAIVIMIYLLTILMRYKNEKIEIKKKAFHFLVLYAGGLLISSLVKLDFQMYILSIIFYISVAFMFTHIFTFDAFFEKYSNIMCFLSIFSIVSCYILKPIIFKYAEYLPTVTNSAGIEFIDLQLSYIVNKSSYLRNFSIFREPGVFGIFLNIALFYELGLNKKKIRLLQIVILLAAAITTFSPPTILVSFLIAFISVARSVYMHTITKKQLIVIFISLVALIVLVVLACFISSNVYWIVTESIKKVFTSNNSTFERSNALIEDIVQFFHSPIWGNKFASTQGGKFYSIASSTGILAIFGLLGGIPHLVSFWLIAKQNEINKVLAICYFLLLLILFNTQFMVGNTIFWIFSFTPFMIHNGCDDSSQIDIMDEAKKVFISLKKRAI